MLPEAGQAQRSKDVEVLRPLVDRVLLLSQRPSEAAKKKLWADHQVQKPGPRAPVTVYYEGIPSPQWEFTLGRDALLCEGPLARHIERDLRTRIWMAENVCDDHIVWPSVVVHTPVVERRGWGVELKWRESGLELGAKGYDPPFRDGIDVGRLSIPEYDFDETAVNDRLSETQELTSGKLDVHPDYAHMGYAPFDISTRMRGMEGLLLDVALEPDKVTALMEFITTAMERHDQRREEHGWVNVHPDRSGTYQQVGFRVHCAYLEDGFNARKPKLADEWVYLSAQTSAGLGPRDFERFVHPYSARLARPFEQGTVYYHGCERLDDKLSILAQLPNLRRFHVSPWSSLEKACEQFQGKVVLEVHDHPGKVFFGSTADDTRARIRELLEIADGHPMDLNLSDIHSINGNPDLLKQWATIAREEVERCCN